MKRQINVRLSETACDLLKRLAEEQAISQAAVLELLLRREAKRVLKP